MHDLQRNQEVQEDHEDPWDPVHEDEKQAITLQANTLNFACVATMAPSETYHWAWNGLATTIFGLVYIAHLRREVL